MRAWLKAFHRATGPRKYVWAGATVALATVLQYLQSWLPSNGYSGLRDLQLWQIAFVVAPSVIAFWFLQRLVFLEEAIRPKLEICVGEGAPFIQEFPRRIANCDPTTATERPRMIYYRVRVDNRSQGKSIRNVLVEIDNGSGPEVKYLPARLWPMHATADNVDIHPTAGAFFDLAIVHPSEPKSQTVLGLHNTKLSSALSPGIYKLTLRALGRNAVQERTVTLEIGKNGAVARLPILDPPRDPA
jgi:hypothetical protein